MLSETPEAHARQLRRGPMARGDAMEATSTSHPPRTRRRATGCRALRARIGG